MGKTQHSGFGGRYGTWGDVGGEYDRQTIKQNLKEDKNTIREGEV